MSDQYTSMPSCELQRELTCTKLWKWREDLWGQKRKSFMHLHQTVVVANGGKFNALFLPCTCQGSAHSGSVSWDDCGEAFPDELHVSLFPWWVPTLCLDSIVIRLQLPGSRVYACLAVTCHLHFWLNDWVSYFVQEHRGERDIENMSQHKEFKEESEDNSPAASARDQAHDLQSQVWCSPTELCGLTIKWLNIIQLTCWEYSTAKLTRAVATDGWWGPNAFSRISTAWMYSGSALSSLPCTHTNTHTEV